MTKEIPGYAIGFIFGHVRIQIEYIYYLICVHLCCIEIEFVLYVCIECVYYLICVSGAKSNWTLP